MLPNEIKDLATVRLQHAQEDLESSKLLLEKDQYKSAANRSYYAIFHAMRAVLALDGEDYKKHSAAIARFTLNYLKTDILSREFGTLIANAALIRNRSDYEDFYICSVEDTSRLVEGAQRFLDDVRKYTDTRYTSV